jgi:hypothetical protein
MLIESLRNGFSRDVVQRIKEIVPEFQPENGGPGTQAPTPGVAALEIPRSFSPDGEQQTALKAIQWKGEVEVRKGGTADSQGPPPLPRHPSPFLMNGERMLNENPEREREN